MISKYRNDQIGRIWSTPQKIAFWTLIEQSWLRALDVGWHGTLPDLGQLCPQIREAELATGHEVGGFLQVLDHELAKVDDQLARRWVHFGLTSSNLVDTGVALAMNHSNLVIWRRVHKLTCTIDTLSKFTIAGRTHGQVASPTTIRARFSKTLPLLNTGGSGGPWFPDASLGGAVGQYRLPGTRLAADRAVKLMPFFTGVDRNASQVMNPSYLLGNLAQWNQYVLACEQIALDVRLMTTLGEARPRPNLVGSSAMPGKVNPIQAEQVCGLAKVWRGMYGTILDSRALWLERDLHHSSIDRSLLPDLAELTAYLLDATHATLEALVWVPTDFSSLEPAIDADALLGFLQQEIDLPRSVLYSMVSVAVRSCCSTEYALRALWCQVTTPYSFTDWSQRYAACYTPDQEVSEHAAE